MRLSVQLSAIVLATAIALAGFASPAMAHKTTIGSEHTIDFTPDAAGDRFAGQVNSAKSLCERGRSIALYREVGDSTVPDRKVAATTTAAVLNETGVAGEADFCNIQHPTSITASSGGTTAPIYGHLYEAGTTEGAGAAANVVAEVGFGPAGSDPRTAPGWRFTTAGFNTQAGDNDEYSAALSAPTVSSQTSYGYAYRFSLDGGGGFTYCDTDGAGSGPGQDFDPGALGTLTVAP